MVEEKKTLIGCLFWALVGTGILTLIISARGEGELRRTNLDKRCDPEGIYPNIKAMVFPDSFWKEQLPKIDEGISATQELIDETVKNFSPDQTTSRERRKIIDEIVRDLIKVSNHEIESLMQCRYIIESKMVLYQDEDTNTSSNNLVFGAKFGEYFSGLLSRLFTSKNTQDRETSTIKE